MTAEVIYGVDFADKRIGQLQADGSVYAGTVPAGTTMTEDAIDALKFNAMARFWERMGGYPAGSYRGSHMGTPMFEVDELPGDCA